MNKKMAVVALMLSKIFFLAVGCMVIFFSGVKLVAYIYSGKWQLHHLSKRQHKLNVRQSMDGKNPCEHNFTVRFINFNEKSAGRLLSGLDS